MLLVTKTISFCAFQQQPSFELAFPYFFLPILAARALGSRTPCFFNLVASLENLVFLAITYQPYALLAYVQT